MAFQKQPHFVLIPFLAQGHLLPMVDMARSLAQRGVIVTIFTTPVNYKRVERVISRAISSGLLINVIQLDFPVVEAGLPEGCECLDLVPSVDLSLKFFAATKMLQPLVEKWLEKLEPAPTCIVSDAYHPWTSQVSENSGILRLIFHGLSCFPLLCAHNLSNFKKLNEMSCDSEYFAVPDMPHHIEMTKAQIAGLIKHNIPEWQQFEDEVKESEDSAFGVVVNTFRELEPDYVTEYQKAKGKKVWCIGPVSLYNRETLDMAERGNHKTSSFNLKWLDSFGPNSVIYACLGSICRLSTSQLIELGLGLEQSNRPFIWVISEASEEFNKWFEKFEERVEKRGLVIQGWSPQVLILSHPSVGAFLTHCGWNSITEGISNGVAMITWPMFLDQFVNERLVVDVLRIGVKAGMEAPILRGQEEAAGDQVSREDVKRAIEMVMDEGEEGEMRRNRVKELGKMARKAVEEAGSSCSDITQLIQDVLDKIQKENGIQRGNNGMKF